MAVSTVTNRVAYQGDGTSSVFAFSFETQAQVDLAVFTYNSSATSPGLIIPQVLNTHYSFSGSVDPSGIYPNGGNIIFNSTPNAQTQVVVFRSSVVTNNFFMPQNGTVPSTALNNTLDRLTLIAQRLQDLGTRSVRLEDGYPRTFDTALPANIAQAANKRLIVNSTASGWTFDETVGNYIQNTVIIADTNSSLISLGGAAPGKILVSNGSSAPSWGDVVFGSTAISGIIQQVNGGTGTGSTFTQGRIIFAGPLATFSESAEFFWDDTVKKMGIGPSAELNIFTVDQAAISAGLHIGTNSNVVGVGSFIGHTHADSAGIGPRISLLRSRGGVGGPSIVQSGDNLGSYIGAGFDGSAYITAAKIDLEADGAPGLLNVPGRLRFYTNSGSGNVLTEALQIDSRKRTTTFGELRISSSVLANNILVVNNSGVVQGLAVLDVGRGGTGTATSYIQYGVIYASSATQFATVPSAAANRVLTSNGSSAPTWNTIPGGTTPTVQIITSSSGIYTTPVGCRYFEIQMIGGGGGGAGSCTNGNNTAAGTAGASTFFGSSVVICGGGAGATSNTAGSSMAVGGSVTIGSGIIVIISQAGSNGNSATNGASTAMIPHGGAGGNSPVFAGGGPGGAPLTPGNAATSFGAGGGGGGAPAGGLGGYGGASGGYANVIVTNPGSSYTYAIGAFGAGAGAGTGGHAAGAGRPGVIIVKEYY